jgi:hypothetical protein
MPIASLVAFASGLAAAAQPIEAQRYRTADGIEVLTSRATAMTPAAAVAVRPAAPAASRVAVPSTDQSERDKDRVAILAGELLAEGRQLEQKRKALRDPKTGGGMTSEQLQALRDEVQRHENNVLSLNREIRRVSASAAGRP